MFKTVTDNFYRYMQPTRYRGRIEALRQAAEFEISQCIDELLSKPQYIITFEKRMSLIDAIALCLEEKIDMLEVEAPLLTFPRATANEWNGDIDHVDTLTGTYTIFTGSEYDIGNVRYMRSYKGAPQFISALRKVLGRNINITMHVDPKRSPSARILLVLPTN